MAAFAFKQESDTYRPEENPSRYGIAYPSHDGFQQIPYGHTSREITAIAHAAYIKYVPRIGREPPPMLADFAAEIAAGHVVVIEVARAVEGYLISWPKMEAYFIDNIAVDPAHRVWDWDDS